MIEGLALPDLITIATHLGTPGLVLLLFYDYTRRMDKQTSAHAAMVAEILSSYKNDMLQMQRYYEKNVELVKGYEKVSGELMSVIHLNTQVLTTLVERVTQQTAHCPISQPVHHPKG